MSEWVPWDELQVKMLEESQEIGRLTPWEEGFLASMQDRADNDRPMTENQAAKLRQIWEKQTDGSI